MLDVGATTGATLLAAALGAVVGAVGAGVPGMPTMGRDGANAAVAGRPDVLSAGSVTTSATAPVATSTDPAAIAKGRRPTVAILAAISATTTPRPPCSSRRTGRARSGSPGISRS